MLESERLGATTLRIMTFSKMTLSITIRNTNLVINDTGHNANRHSAECRYAECRVFSSYNECSYTECHSAECREVSLRHHKQYVFVIGNYKKKKFFLTLFLECSVNRLGESLSFGYFYLGLLHFSLIGLFQNRVAELLLH